MRKKILFQIAGIIAAFMVALLLIIETAISHSSTRLFVEAKEELLSLDLQAMSEDTTLRGCAPALTDYCLEHMDEVSTSVVLDGDFRELATLQGEGDCTMKDKRTIAVTLSGIGVAVLRVSP